MTAPPTSPTAPATSSAARRRRVVGLALTVYLLFLAWALLAPTNTHQSDLVFWLGDRLHSLGLPDKYHLFNRLEVIMNAVIVAPVSLLGSFVLRRWTWRDWTAAGFVASTCVELLQLVVLSHRQASFSDIVANTGGAFLGAIAALVVTRWIAPRWNTRRRSTSWTRA